MSVSPFGFPKGLRAGVSRSLPARMCADLGGSVPLPQRVVYGCVPVIFFLD